MSELAPIRTRLSNLIRRALRIGDQARSPTVRSASGPRPEDATRPPDVSPHVHAAPQPQTLVDLSAELLNRLNSGQAYASSGELVLAEQLGQTLAGKLDVHHNPFGAQRYRDLLSPILAQLRPVDLQDATVVDLSCGSLNPFTFSFLLLMLGAERAYSIDIEPIQSVETATRAMATAAGWLLLEPHRILDRPDITLEEVLRNLKGFDLRLLATGDPAGIAPGRLIHRVEPMHTLSLANDEAGVVFSVSLLEHVNPDEGVEALRRITTPGGLGVHVLDLVDHRFYSGEVASPFEFLKIQSSEPLVQGSNRLRLPEFCALFERHGFSVERMEDWANHPPPTDKEQEQFVEPYRSMPRDIIKKTGARLFVRREGASAKRRVRRVQATDAPIQAATRSEPPPVRARDDETPDKLVYETLLATAAGARRSEYVPLDEKNRRAGHPPVKLIAFYLPQFHPIPENDEWWGKGFTEWTNVSKAVPQFLGHYQPHLPGELGFYDLRVPDVQRRQVELARKYGISGFCFYYYWFAGKRLLERPLTQFVSDAGIDFPFCLCWANENWTRRWDGQEDHILIGQSHGDDIDAAFISDIEPLLRHRNYIRIHGRPVLLVYRPGLLRDPAATAAHWREHCRKVGLPDPYLVATEAFDTLDPRTIGFDAAVEFPPNTGGRRLPSEITSALTLVNQAYAGAVYRYTDMMVIKDRQPPPYQLFRAVAPGFDNEPRRPGAGSTYAFASPASYGRWLDADCRATLAEADADKRLVFINAWNEWAEGAYLEPDRRYGYAYLEKTAKVIEGLSQPWTILFVSHDACRGGAQLVLLNFLEWLKAHASIRLKVLCLEPGEWLPRFRELADTVLLSELQDKAARAVEPDLKTQLLDFCGGMPSLIYGNSVASGRVYPSLRKLKAPIVTHFHELETSITRYAADWVDVVLAQSFHHIACSEAVRDNLVVGHGVAPTGVTTVHSSIGVSSVSVPLDEEERAALRRSLGLPLDKHLVMGCGIGMPFRKGADLFIEVGRQLRQQGRDDIHLYWIGDFPNDERDAQYGEWSSHRARLEASDAPQVTFLGVKEDPQLYLRASDIFLLPSREDPFPLVALEAAACGVPIICFDKAGGMPTFVGQDAGRVVPFEDVGAMAAEVATLSANEPERRKLGLRAREKLVSRFTTEFTAPHLLSTCHRVARQKPVVSVIVPNYNHGRYLPERLSSIFSQTFRDFEVIILDDGSSDNSLEVVEQYREHADVRIVRNERNSGSTFKQWLKGIDLVRADIVWIAESDDGCEPDFVEAMLEALHDPRVRLAYANSHVWNDRSLVVGDYTSTDYLQSLSPTKWTQSYQVSAEQEINDGLGVKNTILSASSVMFKKFELSAGVRTQLETMKIAGDWYFFIHAIAGGDVSYTPRKLNYHRRHDESVVGKLLKENRVEQFFLEFYAVQSRIFEAYRLVDGFESKWERYLRAQWNAFFPDRPFEDVNRYYPISRAREQIAKSLSKSAPE